MDESAKRDSAIRERSVTFDGKTGAEIYFTQPGIDIGNGGYPPAHDFIGVDKNYPGYDGTNLPFPDESMKTVHSSHSLEHIENPTECLREWYRVLKVGGHMVIAVPHQYLYEKRKKLPSNFNRDHKRFYTLSNLIREIEEALDPNSYRIRHAEDLDWKFDYELPPAKHSTGCYEAIVILEKIKKPDWDLDE